MALIGEELITAVTRGNIGRVDNLLQQQINLQYQDNDWVELKRRALCIAVEQDDLEMIKIVLEYSTRLHEPNENMAMIIPAPIKLAVEAKHEAAAVLLASAGASMDPSNRCNRHDYVSLYSAARSGLEKLVTTLLIFGADINLNSEPEGTPLHRIMDLDGDPKAVRLLLKYGADIEIKDCNGKTVISKCVNKWKKPLESFFLLLLFGADINKEHEFIRTKIENTVKLKKCCTAFEETRAMPHLGKIIEANMKGDKKESIQVIDKYIKDETKQQGLVAEFQVIKRKYDSDRQLSFILNCLLFIVENMIQVACAATSDCIFTVQGKYRVRDEWYCIEVDNNKKEECLKKNQISFMGPTHGKILCSGWGKNVPEGIINYIAHRLELPCHCEKLLANLEEIVDQKPELSLIEAVVDSIERQCSIM